MQRNVDQGGTTDDPRLGTEYGDFTSDQFIPGMQVFGSDGKEVGEIKEVDELRFLVSRRMARDLYVPLQAVESISVDSVRIRIPSGDVDSAGWEKAPLFDIGDQDVETWNDDEDPTGGPPARPPA